MVDYIRCGKCTAPSRASPQALDMLVGPPRNQVHPTACHLDFHDSQYPLVQTMGGSKLPLEGFIQFA